MMMMMMMMMMGGVMTPWTHTVKPLDVTSGEVRSHC
jgi:hypothetical protein